MQNKKVIVINFIFIVIFSMGTFQILDLSGHNRNPDPFFSISILAPNTNSARNQWVALMAEQLPKIGIGIDVFDLTNWSQISPRSWGYGGPYPIPSYAESGYDILFVGWSWGLDWDPTGLYDSSSITPNGDNFYQYDSQAMDWVIGNYTNSFVLDDRITYAEEIQAILYDDLPEISILSESHSYFMDPNFNTTSWNGLLWDFECQSMENWSILGQTDFYYATPNLGSFHIYEDNFHNYRSRRTSDDLSWGSQIYSGLLERNPSNNNSYTPDIASSIITTNGKDYSIKLKPNVKWTDGTTLNASDVLFSYSLQITPDFNCPNYNYWINYIDNSSINIINEFELDFNFKKQSIFNEFNLALDLVPKHVWENISYATMQSQAEIWVKEEPQKLIGCGPYKLDSYNDSKAEVHLIRNEYYSGWSGTEPNFENIYFEEYSSKDPITDLEAGTIDMVDEYFVTSQTTIPSGVKYEIVPGEILHEIAVNMLHPIIGTGELCPIAGVESSKAIRKAISHMVPRDIIIDEILDGLGAPGVTSCIKASIGFDETLEPYEFSMNIAKHYMEQAGYVYPETNNNNDLEIIIIIIFYLSVILLISVLTIAFLALIKKI